MAGPTDSKLIRGALLLAAIGSAVIGLLLMSTHGLIGLGLCALALADLGLFYLLRRRWRAPAAGPPVRSR